MPTFLPDMTEELRQSLKDYAERLVRETGYYSLATVEFLVDENSQPYLIEVNTRLQVEHGITECRYGVDLVEEQINIAFGGKLRFNCADTRPFLSAMRMINPVISGTAFAADTATGCRGTTRNDLVSIDASYGLGEAVVGGMPSSPRRAWVSKAASAWTGR